MSVKDINRSELRDLLKNHRNKIEIVDVYLFLAARVWIRIKGSKLISMNELQSRINEIDFNKEVIFLCRSGARSRMIANLVSSMGKDVANLQYGIFECYEDGKGENLEIDEEAIDKYF